MADAKTDNPRFDNERRVYASDAPPLTKLVMVYLLSRTGKDGQIPDRFKVSVRDIKAAAGVKGFDAVLAALDDCKARGWLEWSGGRGRGGRHYTVMLRSPEHSATGAANGNAPLTGALDDGNAPLTGASMLRSPEHVSEQSEQKISDQKRGADAPAPEPDGATSRNGGARADGSNTAKRGERKTPPDSRPAARADSRKAAPAARPRVTGNMKAEERAARRVNADRMTKLYWEKYGKFTTQTFMSVRSQLRGIMANEVDPREVGMAVARLGKAGQAVTRGTIQAEIGKMRRERTSPAAAPLRRAGAEDHEKYTIGFNGGKVLSDMNEDFAAGVLRDMENAEECGTSGGERAAGAGPARILDSGAAAGRDRGGPGPSSAAPGSCRRGSAITRCRSPARWLTRLPEWAAVPGSCLYFTGAVGRGKTQLAWVAALAWLDKAGAGAWTGDLEYFAVPHLFEELRRSFDQRAARTSWTGACGQSCCSWTISAPRRCRSGRGSGCWRS